MSSLLNSTSPCVVASSVAQDQQKLSKLEMRLTALPVSRVLAAPSSVAVDIPASALCSLSASSAGTPSPSPVAEGATIASLGMDNKPSAPSSTSLAEARAMVVEALETLEEKKHSFPSSSSPSGSDEKEEDGDETDDDETLETELPATSSSAADSDIPMSPASPRVHTPDPSVSSPSSHNSEDDSKVAQCDRCHFGISDAEDDYLCLGCNAGPYCEDCAACALREGKCSKCVMGSDKVSKTSSAKKAKNSVVVAEAVAAAPVVVATALASTSASASAPSSSSSSSSSSVGQQKVTVIANPVVDANGQARSAGPAEGLMILISATNDYIVSSRLVTKAARVEAKKLDKQAEAAKDAEEKKSFLERQERVIAQGNRVFFLRKYMLEVLLPNAQSELKLMQKTASVNLPLLKQESKALEQDKKKFLALRKALIVLQTGLPKVSLPTKAQKLSAEADLTSTRLMLQIQAMTLAVDKTKAGMKESANKVKRAKQSATALVALVSDHVVAELGQLHTMSFFTARREIRGKEVETATHNRVMEIILGYAVDRESVRLAIYKSLATSPLFKASDLPDSTLALRPQTNETRLETAVAALDVALFVFGEEPRYWLAAPETADKPNKPAVGVNRAAFVVFTNAYNDGVANSAGFLPTVYERAVYHNALPVVQILQAHFGAIPEIGETRGFSLTNGDTLRFSAELSAMVIGFRLKKNGDLYKRWPMASYLSQHGCRCSDDNAFEELDQIIELLKEEVATNKKRATLALTPDDKAEATRRLGEDNKMLSLATGLFTAWDVLVVPEDMTYADRKAKREAKNAAIGAKAPRVSHKSKGVRELKSLGF